MTGRTLTRIVVIAAVAGLLIYDGIILMLYGFEATISEFIVTLSFSEPIVPFLAGVLCGHLFWSYRWQAFQDLRLAVVKHQMETLASARPADLRLYEALEARR